ncbi:MAG: type II toxin-antitoxin system RelE/ParE family toxin [Verrucomicrobia bacterium]|nr:type II toxin-antitoxin system RelE/ParE family toxin [Verrucomicrobiota bacterium]
MTSWTGRGAATRVHSPDYDADFWALSAEVQSQIEDKIHAMGLRLAEFPHHRMKGSSDFRLRVGDYRVIYQFNVRENVIYLYAIGHRREVYRKR